MALNNLSKVKRYIDKILLKIRVIDNSPLRNGKIVTLYLYTSIKQVAQVLVGPIGFPKKLHLTAKEIIEEVGKEKWDEAFKFSFVRNPWNKVISHY